MDKSRVMVREEREVGVEIEPTWRKRMSISLKTRQKCGSA
jgi:hypothetical protein